MTFRADSFPDSDRAGEQPRRPVVDPKEVAAIAAHLGMLDRLELEAVRDMAEPDGNMQPELAVKVRAAVELAAHPSIEAPATPESAQD